MSPDSADTRIRQLEQAVVALQSQHTDHERDIRQYAPSLIEQARLGEKLNGVIAELRVVGVSVTELRAESRREADHFNHEIEDVKDDIAAVRKQQTEDRLDVERVRADREAKERDREKVDRRYRITTLIAAIGLLLTMLGLAVTIVTLLQHAPH